MKDSKVSTVSYLVGVAVGILVTLWCLVDGSKDEQA